MKDFEDKITLGNIENIQVHLSNDGNIDYLTCLLTIFHSSIVISIDLMTLVQTCMDHFVAEKSK